MHAKRLCPADITATVPRVRCAQRFVQTVAARPVCLSNHAAISRSIAAIATPRWAAVLAAVAPAARAVVVVATAPAGSPSDIRIPGEALDFQIGRLSVRSMSL
jgi:hypothetical protein